MPGFLVEFGAQAAQVLGGGGGGVGGAGEAFAGALFVVESWGWEERSDMGGAGRRVAGWRGWGWRRNVPSAMLLLPALDVSVVGQWCAMGRGIRWMREGRAYSF